MQERNSSFPPEVKVEELLPNGVRYVFPPRQLRPLRPIGVVLIFFGILDIGIGLLATLFILTQQTGNAMFLVVLVPFMLFGLIPIFVGLFLYSGHSEVELNESELRAIEAIGPFRWKQARERTRLTHFLILPRREEIQNLRGTVGVVFTKLASLAVECDGAERLRVARGYPRNWLEMLARDLAARCNLPVHGIETGGAESPQDQPEVTPVASAEPQVETPLVQPAGSRAVLEQHSNGMTLTMPPVGVWKASKWLFVFGLVWCGFLTIFSILMVLAVASGKGPPWPVLFIPGIMLLVGILLLGSAVNMGRRQAVIALLDDQLVILYEQMTGKKQRQWPKNSVVKVCVGPSGMRVNNVPVMELQFHFQDGGKFGMLAGRDRAELEWASEVMQRALQPAKSRGERTDAGNG